MYMPSYPVIDVPSLFKIIIPVLLMVFALLQEYRVNLLRKVSWHGQRLQETPDGREKYSYSIILENTVDVHYMLLAQDYK